MKKSFLFFIIYIPILLLAKGVDLRLQNYQEKYSVCKGKSNYQISKCLLNGNLNYAQFRGDRNAYRRVSIKQIQRALSQDDIYEFTMENISQTERYVGLKNYLDHLYAIKNQYVVPQFNGDDVEDILRIKHMFNLLQNAELEYTPERTAEFERELLKYQESQGLTADGEIGPRTRRTMQESIQSMIVKIKKNLTIERITREKPLEYILVNIPEFKMHYYEDGIEILNMKVVVGKTKMRTPVFNREMKFVVLNPTWNVPPSIYKKEYAHLSSEKLEKLGLRYGSNGKLYQPSGSRNALGLVKFLFPNKFNVYMHDTPAKSRFLRTCRAFSHGCIRLEKPMELLHELGYDYKPGKTTWKTLERRIPVFVEYHTAWIDEEGAAQFRPDIYGYEKKFFTKPVRQAVPRPCKAEVQDLMNDF